MLAVLPAHPAKAAGREPARPVRPWALVTGASDGIGKATGHSGSPAAGLHVVLVARQEVELRALATEIDTPPTASRRRCSPRTSPNPARSAVAGLTKGRLDIGLVVLAAGFGTTGSFLEIAAGR